jgi:hypothetical protein
VALKDAFLLAALSLAAASGKAVAEPAATVKSTASLASGSQPPGRGERVAALRRAVLQGLRNPGTARFRSEFLSVSADAKSAALCGWVNAEDQEGRRPGFVAFIASDDGAVLYAVADPYGSFPHLWRTHCAGDGDDPGDARRQPARTDEAYDSQLSARLEPSR